MKKKKRVYISSNAICYLVCNHLNSNKNFIHWGYLTTSNEKLTSLIVPTAHAQIIQTSVRQACNSAT